MTTYYTERVIIFSSRHIGDQVVGGNAIGERSGHIPNTKLIFVSPSIRYAGLDMYATPAR